MTDSLSHFGTKGMKWGVRKDSKLRPSNWMAVKPGTPRSDRISRSAAANARVSNATTEREYKKAVANVSVVQRQLRSEVNASREEQLVRRAIDQGYMRVVGPAMAVHVANIPKHSESSDPRVNALLTRTLTQSLDRVETNAGQDFMRNLPRGR